MGGFGVAVNYPLVAAAQDRHVGVVDLLLADSRVDPSLDANVAIRVAAQHGHVAVVERLLADPCGSGSLQQ